MKSTKERILKTALTLFNTLGLPKVTLRTIAKEMGISQGNLNYHFKKREDIITALYYELVEQIDIHMKKNKCNEITLQTFFESSNTVMSNFYRYRFFLLDFVQIIRNNREVKAHYQALTKKREKEFIILFKEMVKNDIIRPEELPNEYLFLYKRFHVMGDFWMSFAQITGQKTTNKTISQFSEIAGQAIYPYLTKKGKYQFKLMFSNDKIVN